VEEKKFLVIFGPNGAGKTTLLKVISTLTRPSGGEVMVGGYKLSKNPEKIRQLIGLVTHSSFLYQGLTGYENLKLYAHLYGISQAERRIEDLAEQMGIVDYLNHPVQSYSRGMKQRLSIARALIHNPPYLLLDEPFTGLDEEAAERLNLILEKFKAQGKTAILTTHNLARGHFIADEIAILNSGKLVFQQQKERASFWRLKEFFHLKVEEIKR
jgi:heme exporter protein A